MTSIRWTLIALSLAILLSSLGTSIANVALPTLATELSVSFQQVQWVVLAYLLATTTLIVSAGHLGDVLGRRSLFLGGILLFAAASALCGLAPSFGWLVAARAAQGLGAAVMMALGMAFVAASVPKEKTGSAMGLLGTMSAAGTALGPTLGGVLIAAFGWRSIFLVNVPLGLVTWLFAWRHVPRDAPRATSERTRFDTLGTLILALTLACYALAMTLGRGTFGARNVALVFAALIGAGVFTMIEANAPSPLVRLALFRDRTLSAGFAMNALVTTVVMATLVVGPFYLSRALGLDAAAVGLIMSAGPLVAALTGVPAGVIVDRLGARRMSLAALLTMVAGASMLAIVSARFTILGYIVPLAVLTAGYALFQAANNTTVMADLHPDQRGVVSGLLNLSRNVGLITGASLMGAVFAAASSTSNVAHGMRVTFAVATAMIGIAAVIAQTSRARA